MISIYRALVRRFIVQVHLENAQRMKNDSIETFDFVHVIDVDRVCSIACAKGSDDSHIAGCSER